MQSYLIQYFFSIYTIFFTSFFGLYGCSRSGIFSNHRVKDDLSTPLIAVDEHEQNRSPLLHWRYIPRRFFKAKQYQKH